MVINARIEVKKQNRKSVVSCVKPSHIHGR